MLAAMSSAVPCYGAIEAGGTQFACAIGDAAGNLLAEERLPTQDPVTTLNAVCAFLRSRAPEFGRLAAIGVGAFGPVILDTASRQYGFIGNTPKPGWSNTDFAGKLSREFAVPIGFDTDVNAAALAEQRWGAARDAGSLVYLTVGTGIGGGAIVSGAPLHGLMHPEIGHIFPRRHPLDHSFRGVCPFHGDCMEGLASGPAIVSRSGAELQALDDTHPQWDIEADYLGQLCAYLVLTLSPQRIVMGGGVMTHARLLPPIRQRLQHWLGGYIDRREILAGIERYVVPSLLGASAGIRGALLLAAAAESSAAAAANANRG
jgi:fructokinase